ncbi:hypothetical protein DPEC_G00048610 [Dallia pectoralis]|uniref:Uncharacterized protein n=1 Tax=Dallia pectoralis TaxID=75939 RepID=A0ACC2HAF4_DALPE|nr:hypothetical protein DPEC_G00048610 [Dallia pectoralis]
MGEWLGSRFHRSRRSNERFRMMGRRRRDIERDLLRRTRERDLERLLLSVDLDLFLLTGERDLERLFLVLDLDRDFLRRVDDLERDLQRRAGLLDLDRFFRLAGGETDFLFLTGDLDRLLLDADFDLAGEVDLDRERFRRGEIDFLRPAGDFLAGDAEVEDCRCFVDVFFIGDLDGEDPERQSVRTTSGETDLEVACSSGSSSEELVGLPAPFGSSTAESD